VGGFEAIFMKHKNKVKFNHESKCTVREWEEMQRSSENPTQWLKSFPCSVWNFFKAIIISRRGSAKHTRFVD